MEQALDLAGVALVLAVTFGMGVAVGVNRRNTMVHHEAGAALQKQIERVLKRCAFVGSADFIVSDSVNVTAPDGTTIFVTVSNREL